MTLRPLSRTEARILATLMEKARTVPDTYPLSLNALVAGCNQKTSREPVMQLADAEVQEALDSLKALSLVLEGSSSRVPRYEHNVERVVGVPGAAAAILGLLMLRGPQTAGELRINTERWHRFADISSVEAFLDELAARADDKGGPLVVRLARQPGAREQRWAHLLCGPVAGEALTEVESDTALAPAAAHPLEVRIGRLEAQVAQLAALVEKLSAELGLSQPGQPSDTRPC